MSGFDLAGGAVKFARERLHAAGLSAVIWQDDMRTFALPPEVEPCELAFNLVSSFKHLVAEAGVMAHFKAVAAALVPGGIYVVGFHLVDYEFHKGLGCGRGSF